MSDRGWSVRPDLFRFDRHTLVCAAPGTGRTDLVAEAYFRLLLGRTCLGCPEQADGACRRGTELDLFGGSCPGSGRPVDPEMVVFATLTPEGADEVRQQVLRRLSEPSGRGGPRLSGFESAAIDTLHAFCASVLRDYPVEAGIDADFAVADGRLRDVLGGIVEEVALGYLRRGDRRTAELVFWHTLSTGSEYKRGLREMLVDAIFRMRRRGVDKRHIGRRFHDEAAIRALYDQAFSEFRRALAQLRRLSGAGEPGGERVPQADIYLNRTRTAGMHDIALPREQFRANFDLRPVESRGRPVRGLAEAREKESELAAAYAEFHGLPLMDTLSEILRDSLRRYEEYKNEHLVLDTMDLEKRVLHMFRTAPEVLKDIRGRYRVLIVDEVQEITAAQAAIVRLLCGMEGTADPGGTLAFLAGDPRQAIQRARGGGVAAYRALAAAVGRTVHLTRSREHAPELTHFMAEFGRRVFDAYTTDSPEAVEFDLEASEAPSPPPADCPPRVLILGARERMIRTDLQNLEASRIASLIISMVAGDFEGAAGCGDPPLAYHDMAVLCAAGPTAGLFKRALREHGIPAVVFGGAGFYDRQEIKDVYNALRFIDCVRDDHALLGFLRSPMVGLGDDELLMMRTAERRPFAEAFAAAWPETCRRAGRRLDPELPKTIERLRTVRGRLSVSEFMQLLLDQTGYLPAIGAGADGPQRAANVLKLVDLAHAFDLGRTATLRDFIVFLDGVIDRGLPEGDAALDPESLDAVTLMTIRQARGRAFPVVFIPQANVESGRQPRAEVEVTEEYGLTMAVPALFGGLRPSLGHQRFLEAERKNQLEESKRVLYVGMSCARRRLVLTGMKYRDLARLAGIPGARVLELREIADRFDAPPPGSVAAGPQIRQSRLAPPQSLPASTLRLIERGDRPQADAGQGQVVEQLTTTELNDYVRCPRLFYYSNVLRLRGPAWFSEQPDHKPAGEHPRGRGSFFSGRVSGVDLSELAHQLFRETDYAAADLDAEVAANIQRLGVERIRDLDFLVRYLSDDLRRLLRSDLFDGVRRSAEVYRGFEYHLGVKAISDGVDVRVTLKGVIDLLFRGADTWQLVELIYAAGRRSDPALYRVQLLTHALAVAERFPELPLQASLTFMSEGVKTVPVEVTWRGLDGIKNLIVNVAAGVHAMRRHGIESVEKRPRRYCTEVMCPFVEICNPRIV